MWSVTDKILFVYRDNPDLTYSQVARLLDCDVSFIRRVTRDHNISFTPGKRGPRTEEPEEILGYVFPEDDWDTALFEPRYEKAYCGNKLWGYRLKDKKRQRREKPSHAYIAGDMRISASTGYRRLL